MLRHALFASAVMLAGTFGFAGVASADSATVTFNGQIDGVCSFDNSTATSGTLVSADYWGNGAKNTLVAMPWNGTPAKINVTCNAPGSISVGEPIPSASNPASTYGYAYVYDQYNNYITYNWGGSGYINSGSTMPLQIGMEAYNQNYGQALPSGNYQYTVTLTAVGN